MNDHAGLDPIPTLPTPPSSSTDPAAHRRALLAGVAGLAAGALLTNRAAAGPLDPPAGPIAPTGKTLTEVEPRIAINAANTPGNAASIRRITAPGSYYLAENLTGTSSRSGITIAASNVTIDLNGFAVNGVPGSLNGIQCDVARDNITIRNGIVRNFGGIGVAVARAGAIGKGGLLSGLHVADNGGDGCFANNHSIVRECVFRNNAGNGFVADFAAVIESSLAVANGATGFVVSESASISRCSSRENQGHGFMASAGCLIADCTSISNQNNGIFVIGGVIVRGCIITQNLKNGIHSMFSCTILANTCNANGFHTSDGAGIFVDGQYGHIEGNQCFNHDRGIHVAYPNNLIVRNTCGENTINWQIVANNVVGPILDRRNPNSAAISGNSAPGSVGTTDPWANFTQ